MRILFTFIGGTGHFEPLAPLAKAAAMRGHQVAVTCSGGPAERVRAAGFEAFATSMPRARHARTRDLTPLVPDSAEAAETEFAENFADKGARRHASAVQEHIRTWSPDLVVRDEADFGSAIAAEVLGVPTATVLVLGAGLLVRPDLVAASLRAIRAEHGLPPDAGRLINGGRLVLSPFAPSFRSPRSPVTLDTIPIHFRIDHVKLTETASDSECKRVYATLGTVFNTTSGNLFERLLSGLGRVDADVLVTVGNDINPTEFGPQPGHVRVERFVPQAEVLPTTDLVISHGGSGSLSAALAHGLPSVLLPLGADQPHNAVRATELGVARMLDAGSATPEQIADTARDALQDQDMRRRARAVADEIDALPDVSAAVDALEAFVATS